jgi:hypothetical protein
MKGHFMFAVSHWDLNKEKFVNEALESYKDTNGCTGGYEILRYAAKGALKSDTYTVEELTMWKELNLGYVILRLAKAGKLEFVKG